MPFQKGHAPYGRKTLEPVGVIELDRVRRWALTDLDDWLLMRLNRAFGEKPTAHWKGKLAGLSTYNDAIFITNEVAVLMAMSFVDVMTGKSFIVEQFGYSREPNADVAFEALYAQLKKWGQERGATHAVIGVSSDISPSRIKSFFDDTFTAVVMPC